MAACHNYGFLSSWLYEGIMRHFMFLGTDTA